MQATITLEYSDTKIAKAVANAVSPDNSKVPIGLKVNTVNDDCKVINIIDCNVKLATFTATVDDLLSSAITAEKTLQVIK
ncbi:MAG: hypothetical protein LBC12_08015 [Nitrososphaerota archaeon]|nr:hypothetical protein [Nitrososphaerota archaeon]